MKTLATSAGPYLLICLQASVAAGEWGKAVCQQATWLSIGVQVQKLEFLIKAIQLKTPCLPEDVVWMPPNNYLRQATPLPHHLHTTSESLELNLRAATRRHDTTWMPVCSLRELPEGL